MKPKGAGRRSPKPSEEQAEERDIQAEIATRAYYLWEAAGKPPGRDMDYWIEAEREILGGQEES